MLREDKKDLPVQNRPSGFEDRFRLYVDESGDHVFRDVYAVSHRFLCLLGCWFQNLAYLCFHDALEEVKRKHLPHHPDDPVVLHREDMTNARGPFKNLRNEKQRKAWDSDLLRVIREAEYCVVAVVIDKQALRASYGDAAAHPYHLGLGFLLQRFAGYLNHINRVGDVMAESRGGVEDRLLKESYNRVFERGVWATDAHYFQSALTSKELKLNPKRANILGLQLSDLLVHPVKQWILRQNDLIEEDLAPFAKRLMPIIKDKFNRQLYENRIEGYGWVIYPKK